MTHAQATIRAIDEVLFIQNAHPALAVRMSRANCSIAELINAYDCWLAGITTQWWFSGERRSLLARPGVDRTWKRERATRRARGKAQRQARKANRG